MREVSRTKISLIGLVGLVALGFAFWVSYKSTSGVPLRDQYKLNVAVDQVRRLAKNADVRIAGVRVGHVESVDAQPGTESSKPKGVIKISLDPELRKLPADTAARLRPASILGASYLELQRGGVSDLLNDGDTLMPAKEAEQVEITDLLDTFQPQTRDDFKSTVTELSNFFIGRGESFGLLIDQLPSALKEFGQISSVLAGSNTNLTGFIKGLEGTASALGQVQNDLAELVVNGSAVFEALNQESQAVGQTIDQLQPTAKVAVAALDSLAPALNDFSIAANELRPGVSKLPSASNVLATTLDRGTPAVQSLEPVAPKLQATFAQLKATVQQPYFDGAIRKTNEAGKALKGSLDALTPAQVHCNMLSVWSQNFATLAAFPERGPVEANIVVSTLGSMFELFQNGKPGSNVGINTYPRENANECEAGNEPYDGSSQYLGNPPGLQQGYTRPTRPPRNVQERARKAGLLDLPRLVR